MSSFHPEPTARRISSEMPEAQVIRGGKVELAQHRIAIGFYEQPAVIETTVDPVLDVIAPFSFSDALAASIEAARDRGREAAVIGTARWLNPHGDDEPLQRTAWWGAYDDEVQSFETRERYPQN